MAAFRGFVQFPGLTLPYQSKEFHFFNARSLTSATRKIANLAMKDSAIKCRRPREIIVWVRHIKSQGE